MQQQQEDHCAVQLGRCDLGCRCAVQLGCCRAVQLGCRCAGQLGGPGGGAASGTISFGSNYSDAVPKGAFAATIAGFTSANPNAKVTINTVDHNDFQNNINNYLQGTPDDLFTWFAGFRMRFFASQGLATPIDDVWDKIGANFSDAFKAASKGDDGHYYFVPLYNYPWCDLLPQERLRREGLPDPRDVGRLRRTAEADAEGRPRADGHGREGRLGRPWARSTSSTCA